MSRASSDFTRLPNEGGGAATCSNIANDRDARGGDDDHSEQGGGNDDGYRDVRSGRLGGNTDDRADNSNNPFGKRLPDIPYQY